MIEIYDNCSIVTAQRPGASGRMSRTRFDHVAHLFDTSPRAEKARDVLYKQFASCVKVEAVTWIRYYGVVWTK